MLKVILATLSGYLLTAALVFLLMTACWFAIGPDGAFLPGVWEVTNTWLLMITLSGYVAAMAGGWLAAHMVPDGRAWKALMGAVAVLGLAMAIPVLTGEQPMGPLPRPDDLPMFQAMSHGRQPAWVALLNPLVGALGVFRGAMLVSRRRR